MTAWSPAQGRQDAFPATSAAAFFTTRQLQRTTNAQRTAPDCNARQDSTGRAAMGPSLATFACKARLSVAQVVRRADTCHSPRAALQSLWDGDEDCPGLEILVYSAVRTDSRERPARESRPAMVGILVGNGYPKNMGIRQSARFTPSRLNRLCKVLRHQAGFGIACRNDPKI